MSLFGCHLTLGCESLYNGVICAIWLTMKDIHEVLAYDRARHVVETLEFPELEPDDKLVIRFESYMSDKVTYTFRGKPKTIMVTTLCSEKTSVVVLNTAEEARAHMLELLTSCIVVRITLKRSKITISTPVSFRGILRAMALVQDGYTQLFVSVAYDDAVTKVRVIPDNTGKYTFTFTTFSLGLEDDSPPIIDACKTVKNHSCMLKHVGSIFKISLPFEDSFLTIERIEKSTIFDYLVEGPARLPRLFHDELLAVSWQFPLMKNCIDEHDELYTRWKYFP